MSPMIFATGQSPARLQLRRLLLALLIVTGLGACSSQPTDSDELSEFQWALMSDFNPIFIPIDEYLVPARKTEAGVLESMPVQIRVQRLDTKEHTTAVLNEVLSPYGIEQKHWQLQRRIDGRWVAIDSYAFTSNGFDTSTGVIYLGEFDSIRFVKK